MGEYIQTGICYGIKVRKAQLTSNRIIYDDLIDSLSKHLPLDLYEITEFEDTFIFSLKDEIIEKCHLTEFLTEQYGLLNISKLQVEQITTNLNNLDTAKDIIKFAKEKIYENFQYSNIYGSIHSKWQHNINIEYELIVFFLAGKIIMECYNNFLNYLEVLIKKDNPNELSRTVKALIG